MGFDEFRRDNARVLKHATPMMLAQVIPLGASFVVIAVALALGRADFAAIIGTTATISGLGTLINAVSFIVIAVSAATAVALSLATPHSSDLVVALWIALILQLPANALSSHTSVLAAAFQHLGREKDNLVITLTRTLMGLAIGLAIVVFVSDPLAAIALQSVVASLMVIAMLWERRRRLLRAGIRVRVLLTPDFSPRRIGDRVLNSLDGAVFMVLFMVAQLVAASISAEVAAQVAAGVALCRTIIIPLKMVGQTAGRMTLQDRGREPAYRAASYGVVGIFVVPLALSLILLSAFGLSPVGDRVLGLLIALQLLLEPFSGSLFAYMKVTFGARAGLLGLILTYLVLAPAALIVCRFTAPSAVGLWAALLLVRLLFSVANLAALRTLLRSQLHPTILPK